MFDPQLQQDAGNQSIWLNPFDWLRGGGAQQSSAPSTPWQSLIQPPVFPMPKPSAPPQKPTVVNSQAEFDQLPEGSLYVGPDGTPGWKTGPVMGLP
jgi:hypothetical protein